MEKDEYWFIEGVVDVYYWENQGPDRNCDLSLCDSSVKVLSNVTPLFSWDFRKSGDVCFARIVY